MEKQHPEWNVIYHSWNKNEITTFNIFDHSSFNDEVVKLLKKCKTREQFYEELRHPLMYYFWSKSEWEILISPWIGDRDKETIKVDVYWQIRNNYDRFVDYVWGLK